LFQERKFAWLSGSSTSIARSEPPLHVTAADASQNRFSGRQPGARLSARLRAQGLRPIQIWVPDVRSPEFAATAHVQSAAVAWSEHAAADQALIDAISLDEE